MPDKKIKHPPTSAFFRIVLDVGLELGAMPLEEALEKAKALKVTDVLDLSNLEYNDGSIEVSGVYATLPYVKS